MQARVAVNELKDIRIHSKHNRMTFLCQIFTEKLLRSIIDMINCFLIVVRNIERSICDIINWNYVSLT